AQFRRHGIEVTLTLARSGAQIIDTARQALESGVAMVIAGGGDGTQSAVASVLAGSEVVHGVLALGTLNHFARDLQIPLELDAAIANIANGVVKRVDVGSVNGRIFINNSGLGIYPDLVRDRERQQRRLGRGKWLAFALATLAIARRYPFLDVHLKIDGQEHARRTPFVFIGNNQYQMEGFDIGTRGRIDAGSLCLYMAHRTGRLGLLGLALHALTHRLAQARDFDMLNSDELIISTRRRRLRVATDGEVTKMSTPLHYRIHRAALNVIVPRKGN
ncbi:MAG: diacylglycerol/lipid kinase family protein, partial [Janthinobacterium lividum]